MRSLLFLVAAAALSAGELSAQAITGVELRGPAGQTRVLAVADLAALPQREVRASAHNVAGTFSGVSLADVVRLIGAPSGDSLRGKALASYVLVEAADGYRVTFSLAEFNSSFTDRLILLVNRKDGQPLSDRDGPFQLIVPDEKRPARWVRQVVRISVVMLPAPTSP